MNKVWKTLDMQAESVPEPDEIGNLIEEVTNLARQINLEEDSDAVQELMDSHSQEQTMDLIEIHEQNCTRAFGDGPRNFEPWSSDVDDT
ncbi:hypothetical protein TNCV_3543851 [Trichonephila clavipes]|nr:hypothetical protein TNCV_3543851 [Trichonephila clavipes]